MVEGVQDGDPEALADLCLARGASVLAYCEHVASPDQGTAAAAAAFCLFRESAWIDDDPALDVEGALLHAARLCAARRSRTAATGEHCSPVRLVGWIEQTLSGADRELVEDHLTSCSACADALKRLNAAERGYRRPQTAPLPPTVVPLIVGALLEAAPVSALEGDVEAVREAITARLGEDRAARRDAPTAAYAPSPGGGSTRWGRRKPRKKRTPRSRAVRAMASVAAVAAGSLLLLLTLSQSRSGSLPSGPDLLPPTTTGDTLQDVADRLSSERRKQRSAGAKSSATPNADRAESKADVPDERARQPASDQPPRGESSTPRTPAPPPVATPPAPRNATTPATTTTTPDPTTPERTTRPQTTTTAEPRPPAPDPPSATPSGDPGESLGPDPALDGAP